MLKKELELLEFEENDPPLLNELYVVVSNKKHDSGYKKYKIYGIARDDKGKIVYKKCLSTISDVIHFETYEKISLGTLNIDSIETNLFRFFILGPKKFKVTGRLSDFCVEVVRV